MKWSDLLAAIACATAVLAAPAPEPTPGPNIEDALAKRATTCTFSGSLGYSSASKSKTSCSTIVLSALSVPSGVTLDLTSLKTGTTVIFEGETTFGYKEWSGPLVAVSGTSITVKGASGSSLNGNGASYWDGKGSNGGKTKPKFFQAHSLTTSTIENLNIVNAPVQVFSINTVQTLNLIDITIDNSAGASLGANTDGFDIGSSDGVTITGAKVYNQDDCVAINSGTNINFSGGYCSGGHGLSVGSVGGRSDNTVDGVTFESSQIVNSQNGVRIKTISGDTGTVKGVTYKDITLSGITKYGIVVDQAYDGTAGSPTSGVPITDFTLDGVTGSVSSSATEIYIDCASCSGWTWSGVSVTGGKKSSSCKGVPSGVSC
ncbi:putative Extracellular polygalacturonase [Pleurostoma richardsiae]|uniref:endo-polygalacturonase n=1 Tax=Pleurostoma richardsiae TaxID=41990 RepID=A0AA38VNQ4_9PEZI|nr:putative Extracellular polygalacturonase [Pleurostoma richardsiae]